MLGRDYFKVESNVEMSSESLRSLVLFYGPLIGPEALALYEFFVVKGTNIGFIEINNLLNSLLISIEKFEVLLQKLNEYKLVRTLKSKVEDKYIFKINKVLSPEEFVKNDIYVRNFIKKTSGPYYQTLLTDIRVEGNYIEYDDISKKLDLSILNTWSKEDETYLKIKHTDNGYDFGTLFSIDTFLRDISTTLLPMKFRTQDNLKQIATLADLYNISYDQMRKFLPLIAKTNSDSIDLKQLRYLCEKAECDFRKIMPDEYFVPCELFLMNKQNGKEVSPYDKNLIYNLANKYHLNTVVINVLLEYALNASDNRLIEKYLYAIASDLNRNDVKTVEQAKERLALTSGGTNKIKKNAEYIPVYSDVNNPIF